MTGGTRAAKQRNELISYLIYGVTLANISQNCKISLTFMGKKLKYSAKGFHHGILATQIFKHMDQKSRKQDFLKNTLNRLADTYEKAVFSRSPLG